VVDKLSPAQRSILMSRVRQTDTAPELIVRGALHKAGFRFRLHRKDLPGTPDLVLPRFRTAIFVHGCFWHGHDCRRGRRPMSNVKFWAKKLEHNGVRDATVQTALRASGWHVETIWECSVDAGLKKLLDRLSPPSARALE
jgi:DNA mismatch endonuclease (patch repair protein)